jgi:hypothetical protein
LNAAFVIGNREVCVGPKIDDARSITNKKAIPCGSVSLLNGDPASVEKQ